MFQHHPQHRRVHLTSRLWTLIACIVIALVLGISLFMAPPKTGVEGRTLLAMGVAVTAVLLTRKDKE
jgi:hypothetical protein